MCKKEQTHTEDVKLRGKEGHLQNTPSQQHTERTTTRSPAPVELLAGFESVWQPCEAYKLLALQICSLSRLQARQWHLFKKLLNQGMKIPTGMPLLSTASSQCHPQLLAAVAGTSQSPGINKCPLLSGDEAFKHKKWQVTPQPIKPP